MPDSDTLSREETEERMRTALGKALSTPPKSSEPKPRKAQSSK